MKAAIFNTPRDIGVEEIEKPALSSRGILVKVITCCICGSDLHLYKLGLFKDSICRKVEQGYIPGHELSGEVVQVGSEVKDLAVGDLVMAYTSGGFAEYVAVNPVRMGVNVHKMSDGITPKEAATLEPLGNSVHAALKGNPAVGENAVVFGMGSIGLGVVQVLKALDLGMNKIIAVDVSDKRLETAKAVGADEGINVRREALEERIRDIVGMVPHPRYRRQSVLAVDIVYDCVGYIQDRPEPPVLQQAFAIARPITGRIVEHGIFERPLTLDLYPMVSKQLQITGSYGGTPADVVKGIELIRDKKLDRSALISHEFPLNQAKEAFETACCVEESVKVQILP